MCVFLELPTSFEMVDLIKCDSVEVGVGFMAYLNNLTEPQIMPADAIDG